MSFLVQRSKGGTRRKLGLFDDRREAIGHAASEIERELEEGVRDVTIWVNDPDSGGPRIAHFRINAKGIIERELPRV